MKKASKILHSIDSFLTKDKKFGFYLVEDIEDILSMCENLNNEFRRIKEDTNKVI